MPELLDRGTQAPAPGANSVPDLPSY